MITRLLHEGVQGGSQAEQQYPQVLIISPTRELTLQIYGEARKFVHETMYRPVVIYGGTSVGHQLRQLESGCNIMVSTPGRLMDFLNRKKVRRETVWGFSAWLGEVLWFSVGSMGFLAGYMEVLSKLHGGPPPQHASPSPGSSKQLSNSHLPWLLPLPFPP